MSSDFKAALRLVWMAVTLATAAAAIVPFVVPESTLARWIPPCESKSLYGQECVLCGTTTGFLAIARGDFRTASQSNPLAIPLFIAFLSNAAAAGAYIFYRGPRRSSASPSESRCKY